MAPGHALRYEPGALATAAQTMQAGGARDSRAALCTQPALQLMWMCAHGCGNSTETCWGGKGAACDLEVVT